LRKGKDQLEKQKKIKVNNQIYILLYYSYVFNVRSCKYLYHFQRKIMKTVSMQVILQWMD